MSIFNVELEKIDDKQQMAKDAESELVVYNFGDINNYELCTRIGRGKYSIVFQGITKSGKKCVLKVLKPVRSSKINREIKVLETLSNGPNIPKLLDVVKDDESQMVTLVLEWTNDDLKNIYQSMSLQDIALYIYMVLQSLEYAHSRGIMHRDVKPQNIMIDHEKKQASLIDWGLADHYVPGQSYQVRVATRNYKSPELLLGYSQYTPSMDIWGLGCTFAAFLTRRLSFFRGRDNTELIMRIADFAGSDKLEEYIKKYKIEVAPEIRSKISGRKSRVKDFLKIDGAENTLISDDAFDLLLKMLTVDHLDRISAKDALNHPFFAEVREKLCSKN